MKFNIFELGIFSFNSYVYYLTHGFIASTRAFNLPTRAYNLVTRAFGLLTRGFELVTCIFKLVTREFELVTGGFELVTRKFKLVMRNSQLVFYFFTDTLGILNFLCLLNLMQYISFTATFLDSIHKTNP